MTARRLFVLLLAAIGLTGCTLKYELLKETSLPNPPTAPIKIYVREFPVESKAAVVDPRAANTQTEGQQYITNEMAAEVAPLTTISRSSRIEDLSGAILRELRKEKVRILSQLVLVRDLGEDNVREVDNPFVVVSEESGEADLEITGTGLINSRRVSKVFSQETQNIEVTVTVRDLRTDKVVEKSPLEAGVKMTFNSRELEEAMAVAVVTSLTRKLLF